jgi:hypothetical protein
VGRSLYSSNRPPSQTDLETSTHADRLLVPGGETVIVRRFEIPAEMMPSGGPEHEVTGHFAGQAVRGSTILLEIDPLRTYAKHELCFSRKSPGLLEQQIRVPLRRVASEERGNSGFKLQPVSMGVVSAARLGAKVAEPPVVVQLVAAPTSRMYFGSSSISTRCVGPADSLATGVCPNTGAHRNSNRNTFRGVLRHRRIAVSR